MEERERNYSLDILRIIAIWFVLTVHFLGFSGVYSSITSASMNYVWVKSIYNVSHSCNTIFFILAGFFATKEVKKEKMVFLWRKTVFYSFVITTIALVYIYYTEGMVDIKELIYSAFPIVFKKYWFISVYIVIYILRLVLVPAFNGASKRTFVIIVIVLLLNNLLLVDPKYNLLEALLAFSIGFFIQKYKESFNIKRIWLFFVYVLANALFIVVLFIEKRFDLSGSALIDGLNYFITVVSSTTLVLLFLKTTIKWKLSSFCAKHTIAVYLITSNQLLSNILYSRILHIFDYQNKWYFLLYYCAINITLIIICISVDFFVDKINRFETKLLIKAFGNLKKEK